MKILVVGPASGPCARLADILAEHGCHVVHVGPWIVDGSACRAPLERLLQAHRCRALVRLDPVASAGAACREEPPLETTTPARVRRFALSAAPEARLDYAVCQMLGKLAGTNTPAAPEARAAASRYPLLAA